MQAGGMAVRRTIGIALTAAMALLVFASVALAANFIGGGDSDYITEITGWDDNDRHEGNDLLEGSSGSDGIDASSGFDTVLGQGGPDNLFGDQGKDEIRGGAGADYLE